MFWTFLKKIFAKVFTKVKEELSPVTLGEFTDWINDVIALTRLPNNDSMKFAVSTVVLESKDKLTKKEAAARLEKGAQNQFAAFIFQDIKSKRMAQDEAAHLSTPASQPQDAEFGAVEAPVVNTDPQVPNEVEQQPSV